MRHTASGEFQVHSRLPGHDDTVVWDFAEVTKRMEASARITDPDPNQYDQPVRYNNQRVDLTDPDLFSSKNVEKFWEQRYP